MSAALMSTEDLAKYLGKSARWVRDQRRQCEDFPPGINLGSERKPEWHFRRSAVEAYLRRREMAA